MQVVVLRVFRWFWGLTCDFWAEIEEKNNAARFPVLFQLFAPAVVAATVYCFIDVEAPTTEEARPSGLRALNSQAARRFAAGFSP
jgi:hypothetical protein